MDAREWRASQRNKVGAERLRPERPAPPPPLCVKFEVRQGRASILGLIEVGTQRDGVTGPPRFLGIGLTIGLADLRWGCSILLAACRRSTPTGHLSAQSPVGRRTRNATQYTGRENDGTGL